MSVRNPLAHDLNLRSPKDRATLRVREEQAKLNVMLDEYLMARGGVRTDLGLGGWLLQTPLGELRVTPEPAHMAGILLTVFCRFDDVDRACAKLNVTRRLGGDVNPYSGKWNFHVDGTAEEAFRTFRTNLEVL